MANPILVYNPFTDNFDYADTGGGGGGGGGFTWLVVTSLAPVNPITPAKGFGYCCNGAAQVTFILPLAPNFGDSYEFSANQQTFRINQNANQRIRVGAQETTLGITGYLLSNFIGDRIILTYLGNNIFQSGPPQGSVSLF